MPDALLNRNQGIRLPTPSSALGRRLLGPTLVRAAAERALALTTLDDLYAGLRTVEDPVAFAQAALAALGVTIDVDSDDVARIPLSGPTLVCANHPYGAIEGLILLATVGALRSDVRVLANRWLAQIEPLRPALLSVDVFDGDGSTRENARAFRSSLEHLRRGGTLIVFPAGAVSRLAVRDRQVRDGAWSSSVVRMSARADARIVPAWFTGRNSALFQVAGLVHPNVSTALLPRELLKKRGASIRLALGTPIAPGELAGLEDDACRVDYVRLRAAVLAEREPPQARTPVGDVRTGRRADRPDPSRIAAEVRALPPERTLARSSELDAFVARRHEIPTTLFEVGRQREIAFRAAGEGTGNEYDVDEFDDTYHHLVLWDRTQQRVAGAYRLGATDEILPLAGPKGLYTTSLFDWDDGAHARLGTALELGRSFVVGEYQRTTGALSTLWRGIGAFVARNPRYTRLFGPVSISSRYGALAQQLIAQHLQCAHACDDLIGRVHPKNPLVTRRVDGLEGRRLVRALGASVDIDALVSDLHGERCGLPVLLREYLRLGGKVVATSVDADFQDALDALVVLDLRVANQRLLERYFGRDAAASFRAACPAAVPGSAAHAG